MPHTTHTTPGDFIAAELIAAKRTGNTFTHATLSAFIDIRLEQWDQTATKTAIPATPRAPKPRNDIPPSPEAVTAYFQAIGYPVSGEEFCDSYAQKGWLVGKAKMKDWHAACRNWKTNGWGKPIGVTAPRTTAPRKPIMR